jgi:hypothetical protein
MQIRIDVKEILERARLQGSMDFDKELLIID